MTAKAARREPPAARARGAPARPSRPRAIAPDAAGESIAIRPARRSDLDQVVALDARVTGIEKPDYWRALYRRYAEGAPERRFLVAERGDDVVGFVIGEVRDWEFGSPRCGWVFAIDVAPEVRQIGVGARLLAAVCAGFRRAGVQTVRTMTARGNTLVLSFFRSQGMMAGPFIPLEMELE
jgi:ribosomal protein S18 acetylase RimI-like enzyme